MTRGREGSTTSSATPPHVVLCDPPVTFARAEAPDDPSGAGSSRAPPKSRFFFDEANDWVIAHEEETVAHEEDDDATTTRIRCHPLPPRGIARPASGAGRVPPRPVSIRVPPGPALDARVSPQRKPSLDRRDFRAAPRLVAIKRSDVAIDVYRVDVVDVVDDDDDGVARGDRSSSARYELRRAGSERILSFFWSHAPDVDLVVVTTRGLEQYACDPGCRDVAEDDVAGGGASRADAEGEGAKEGKERASPELALVRVGEKRMKGERPVGWVAYDVDSKLVMLGSGPGHARLNAWQFSSTGAIKLPRFELPTRLAGVGSPPASPPSSSLGLRGEDVRLLTLYGRVFLAVADRPRGELVLHRVHRDALVKERVANLSPLLLYTEGAIPRGVPLNLSIVDNVLCVHAAGSGLVSAIDVAAVSSNEPNGGNDDDGVRSGDLPGGEVKPLGATPSRLGGGPADVRGLTCAGADVVVDVATGRAWKLALDLRAASEVAGGGDVAASVAFLQRRSQAPWAGEVGSFGDDGERDCGWETAPTTTLTRRGAATPPFSPPFSPPASPTPRRLGVVPPDAESFHAIDDAHEGPRALTLDAMRRSLHRGDDLGTSRAVFAAVCGSYVEARSRGAAAAAGARFRASFRARGGVDRDDDPSPPEPRRRATTPRRRDVPPSSPAVSPSDAYELVFRPHVHALLLDHPGVVMTGGRRGRRRAIRAARAAVVEYLLAAEQSGASRVFGAGRRLSSSGSSLGSSRGAGVVAACARLCVAASFALGEARRASAWGTLLADDDDDGKSAADFLRQESSSARCRYADDCDADAAAGDIERRAWRGTAAATVCIPGDGLSSPVASDPAETFASLTGRPVRLAAAHRWYEETSPGVLRGTPLGAKYRRAFDPDGDVDDGDGDGAGTDEVERGEVRHPGDATPRD